MAIYPKQKLPLNEKDDAWKHSNVDYLADNTDFYAGDKRDFSALYRAASGKLDKEAYKYVLNPYNSTDENLQNYPAMMRNMDIITPIINLYMGEMADKPTGDEVIVNNADVLSKYKEGLNQQMMALASQDFINQLNASGQNTGIPSQELPDFKKFAEEYKENWNDQRAIFGQEALDYIKYNCDLKDKIQDAFYDWLVTGHCYSFKEPRDKDVHYEIIPPYELWHGISSTNFIEDANFAVRRFRRTPNAIVDMFRHYLKPDDITWLETLSTSVITTTDIGVLPNVDNTLDTRVPGFYDKGLNLIDIFHATWKSFKEVAILTYTDELGQEQEMEVNPNYILNEEQGDIKLTKEYISEVWEGYRIDKHLYLKIQPISAQRNELNNSSKCKLPYNGRVGYNKHTATSSIVRQLLNYQALYNIYHYRGELTLARSKDKIMTMPIGLIPKGWSPEKALWFAETTGIMWFDETAPNAAAVLSAIKGVDLSLGNYVQQMRELLKDIKDEAWDSVGMNRQRYGDSKASDGKGVTDQAIMRSSTITRELFRRFEKFIETDKQGLLDISKVAWVDGKKSMYVTSDGRKKFFEVNSVDHLESDYGVFYKDSSEEQGKLQEAKGVARMMAQKGGVGASLIFETIDANNFSQLKKYARKFEDIQQEQAKAEQDANRQNEQVLQDKIDKNDAANRDNKIQVATITTNGVIEAAQIKAHTDITTTGMNNQPDEEDTEKDSTGLIMREYQKAKQEKDKLALIASKNNQDALNKEADLNLKNKKINADIKKNNSAQK
jgi:hypothetical protein